MLTEDNEQAEAVINGLRDFQIGDRVRYCGQALALLDGLPWFGSSTVGVVVGKVKAIDGTVHLNVRWLVTVETFWPSQLELA